VFDFRDLSVLRAAKRLETAGVSSARVRRILARLRHHTDAPLSQLALEYDNGRVVVAGDQRWEPETGQYELFGEPRQEAPVEAAPVRTTSAGLPAIDAAALLGEDPGTAHGWFELALTLEEVDPQRSYEAYLRALACDPEHVEALINVGRLCSSASEYTRAAAYFRQAIRIDPAQPVAHFNLGVTLHDLGDVHGAIVAYRTALIHDRTFADAHYNLATLLEEQGDRQGALKHMNAYKNATEPT
jgi:tetratricopeptide (TPR) repeat protein